MKVAIIGCGITGSYLGWRLRGLGHEVTIFEKRAEIGKAVCSGLISERLWNFIPENKNLVEHSIEYANVHFPKWTGRLKFKQRMLLMSHAELDRYVALLAENAGVKIILNHKVDELPTAFDRVIGTDGALSATRKLLGLKEPHFKMGLQFFTSEKNSDNFVDTWPTANGFFWKIPRGLRVEYGIMEEQKVARGMLDEYCSQLKVKIADLQAWPIPGGMIVSNNPTVTLCGGDACGLTKPWSGGGVIWSLTAANILLRNFPDFEEYHKELKRFFGWQLFKTRAITKLGYILGNYVPWLLPKEREIDSDFIL
ncbi:MAG: NAD(P)/FAD-dependent oxidoreductase [DPANN group archaeon]|nr:NAD(P)/FAD-dependent oxidoreductase [DPANN group archaeon]